MATSAFKSTTKRSSIISPSNTYTTTNDAGSSNRAGSNRRSRSLSRFSGRYTDSDQLSAPARGNRSVNTDRGFESSDMSLDDLVNEFFPVKDSDEKENDNRGRLARRSSCISPSMAGTTTTRRGRSVSRQHASTGEGKRFLDSSTGNKSTENFRRGRSVSRHHSRTSDGIGKNSLESSSFRNNGVDSSRRRRSVSVAKYQFSDSESDHSNHFNNHAKFKSSRIVHDQKASIRNPTATNPRRALRRTMSHRDLSKSHEGYSSQSSALTDEESQDSCLNSNDTERTIRTVYAQKKSDHPIGNGVETGLYETMRKELRYAIQEIKTELVQVMGQTKPSGLAKNNLMPPNEANALQAVSLIRDNYATRLEQSEKRKNDLLAEMVVEEQRGRELSKIVKELLPNPKSTAGPENSFHARKRNNDRRRMSNCLTEEAEKYIEDFLSNVEDTDISSLDGERSDASSKLGGRAKSRDTIIIHLENIENFVIPTQSTSVDAKMDGVVLPWLEWETSNDGSPTLCKSTPMVPVMPENNLHETVQETSTDYNKSNCFISNRESWSLAVDTSCVISRDLTSSRYSKADNEIGESWFDTTEYHKLQHNEYRFLENWKQRERINSGGLLLCNRNYI